jgi:FkbM family methyltransferase
MYSQNDEQVHIVDYYNATKGKFLDIGAYNPFKFSNTRALYEMEWSGIFIEPSPICFENFVKEYGNDDKITLINKAVVTDERVQMAFFESGGDAVSTSNLEHKNKWEASGAKFNIIEVSTISVSEIEKFKDIDFMSLDVESSNYEIFMAFSDQFLNNLSMICIEHDGKYEEIKNRLEKLNFKPVSLNAENLIMSK